MARALQTFVAYAIGAHTISDSTVGISNTNFGWTTGQLAAAQVAEVAAFSQGLVISFCGVDPAATKGIPVPVNTTYRILGQPNIANLRLLRAGSTDAVASIQLEK